jgi:hypothetical protein
MVEGRHSVLAFNSSSGNNNNSNNKTPTPVRTIVLPAGGGYAFLAAGKIFWVRRCQAAVVSAGGMGNSSSAMNNNNSMTAHAVVTEHVIGGTGNRNSRRGQEVATGRVFAGDGGASGQAAMAAAQQLQRVQTQQQGPNVNISMRVTWLPIGMPNENASNSDSHAHLQEWPDRHLWVQQHRHAYAEQQQESCFKQQRDDSECSYYSVNSVGASAHDDANHVFGTTTTSMDTSAPVNVNMLMAPPAAKRQCRQPDAVAAASWPTR